MDIITINHNAQAPVIGYSDINDLYNRFIDYTDVKDTTLRNYAAYIRQFLSWLNSEGICSPQREDIKAYKEYLNQHKKSAGTRQQYLRAVKHFFKWTANEGLYPNIADGIKCAKVRADNTKKEAFNEEELKEILESIDRSTEAGKRNYCIILLGVTCALRINEMRLADIGDIQTIRGERVLYIQGKGHDSKDDYKKIVPQLEEALEDYLSTRSGASKSEPLFTGTSNRAKGQRITEPSMSRIIKNVYRAAGYDSAKLTAHSLRHSSNTLLFKTGADLYTVQHHARHLNPATTEIYIHAVDKAQQHTEQQIYNQIFNTQEPAADQIRQEELLKLLGGLTASELAQLTSYIRQSSPKAAAAY